ncbi:4673_t:CDS:2 [Ambispora leptoticha]|uniref:4673_t:CDS:1 n=1 Tax=Ambispora leptoticha TaxID=144679 RepID=A0A9N9GLK7_9GLOM|nr:4673_t:CDS:2 [Ambispora leptoticha]
MPTNIIKRHQKLAAKMAKKHETDSQTITHLMFHGTTYRCRDPITTLETKVELCENKGCAMCGILRKGNKTRNRWFWWKKSGIWSSNDPAHSLIYSLKCDQRPYIMFALDVLAPLPGYTLKVFNKAVSFLFLIHVSSGHNTEMFDNI